MHRARAALLTGNPNLSGKELKCDDDDKMNYRTFTLYLIRHGEACHNVQEKIAQDMARQRAIDLGLHPDSPEATEMIKNARTEILKDPSFFDATLSETGVSQAKATGSLIQDWIANEGLEPPDEVFVSPLQRALQTADNVFPGHAKVRVREELRERLTGRPADNRASSRELMLQQSFQRFSFRHLRLASHLNGSVELALDDSDESKDCLTPMHSKSANAVYDAPAAVDPAEDHQPERVRANKQSSFNADHVVENSVKLAQRTKKLFHLLGHSQHRSIAVVTHKAYLRELERNQFGQTDAKEFKNCEVRVYRLTFDAEFQELQAAVRIR